MSNAGPCIHGRWGNSCVICYFARPPIPPLEGRKIVLQVPVKPVPKRVKVNRQPFKGVRRKSGRPKA